MGMVDVSVLLDFVSSIAVLGLLVLGFGALASGLKKQRFNAPFLGVLFGLVAGWQMSMPLSPTAGVIVDMRNVPVVLAGAFLGARGVLACLMVTISIRLGVGGVGAVAGILGMLIAAGVGYIWAAFKHRIGYGSNVALAILGIAVNLHMLSAFAVPLDITRWYFAEAAPTVAVLNLLCVPALGWLLTREQETIVRQAHLSAAAQVDPTTRLLTPAAFAQEVAHLDAADGDRRVVGMIALTLKNRAWLKKTWGEGALDQALGGLRVRLVALYGPERPMGTDSQNRLLVPVTAAEMRDLRPMRRALRLVASDTPLRLDGDVEVPLSVVAESVTFGHPDKPEETLRDIRNAAAPRRTALSRLPISPAKLRPDTDTPLPVGVCGHTYRRLFDETDQHFQQLARLS
ncbi:MAG: LytS/YhcK type 5TM receptor domain-containing protein [Tateyamaria sp.]